MRWIAAWLVAGLVLMAVGGVAVGTEFETDELTYPQSEIYNLPSSHEWFIPVMGSLARDPAYPIDSPLPWRDSYFTFQGKMMIFYEALIAWPFGYTPIDYGSYPPDITQVPAATYLLEFNNLNCNPANLTPGIPVPPRYSQAKAAADGYCRQMCGPNFAMTDFDMNQWNYVCYNRNPKSYKIVTWGGTRCEQTSGSTTIACNPLTGMIETRNHLGQMGTQYDLDQDGKVTLRDLVIARNQAYGPKLQGLGLSYALMYPTNTQVQNTGMISQFVQPSAPIPKMTYMKVTEWAAGYPVDCNDVDGQIAALMGEVSATDAMNQQLANDWCQRYHGLSVCVAGALGFQIGHCVIDANGVHYIRLTIGYCMKCA